MYDELTENGILSPEANHAILPVITALFVDGLGSTLADLELGIEWLGKKNETKRQARIYRLPIETDESLSIPDRPASNKRRNLRKPAVDRLKTTPGAVNGMRPLIRGISHNFNNLLMGIWGNVTMMRLQLNNSDPLFARVTQLEYLVQSGANLINLVLGYLGERRIIARRLRLNQLIAQVRSELPEDHAPDMGMDLERLLQWASRVQRPRIVASSTARVLDLLFKSIEFHCHEMRIHNGHNPEIQKKTNTIRELLLRGFAIIDRLRMYAADRRPKMRRVGVPSLIKGVSTQLRRRNPAIDIRCRISPRLPMVRGERGRLEWVFSQLISNATEAMPNGGILEITACTLQEKSPQSRCAVQKGSDYVVIDFKDTGCGMSAKLQKHIFEPYFTFPHKHSRQGLGLAAAAGVLKSHNGYIQVISKANAGSTFSVYLPIAGAAVQEQQLKQAR